MEGGGGGIGGIEWGNDLTDEGENQRGLEGILGGGGGGKAPPISQGKAPPISQGKAPRIPLPPLCKHHLKMEGENAEGEEGILGGFPHSKGKTLPNWPIFCVPSHPSVSNWAVKKAMEFGR
jgi:hypothetical protein